MRAIVTGGAGFIGSHLVDALLARGDDVHVVDNLSTGIRENFATAAELHELDVRSSTQDLFTEIRPQVCFHLAAQVDVATSVARPDFDAEVNVVGTVRVVEAARAVDARVVFTSSGGALYGERATPAAETEQCEPLSPYGASKLAGEEYLKTWNRLYGTSHVIARLANVYGARQSPELEGGAVAIFLDALGSGKQGTIFGDGEQTRDFVYVEDVVAALLAAVGGSGVYNVGTGVPVSVNELYRLCADAVGAASEPHHGDPRPGDLRHSVLDPSRAQRELGWRATTQLPEGLARTAAA